MQRREFLKQTGLTIGVASVVGLAESPEASSAGPDSRDPAPFRPDDFASIRDQFSLTRNYVHMASFLLTSHPRPVAEAIERHLRALDENPVGYFHEQRGDGDARTRAAAAEYMGGNADDIALTDSTTMGLGLLYNALRLSPGDEILTTTHDHYSTQMSLKYRAARTGGTVREIAFYDDAADVSTDEVVARLRKAVNERTRVLAVTWVHSSTGVKLPIAAMAAAVHEINAERDPEDRLLFCVDGVHGFGIEREAISDLGCDFFVAGTHKWIFGPRGTGVIWGRSEAWKRVQPIIPSFGRNYGAWLGKLPFDEVTAGDLMTPGGFHSFEHRWALPEAFHFHLAIGKARVADRIHALNTMAKDALADMAHVKLHTPRSADLSAGIICFEVSSHSPGEVVESLLSRGIIASTSPYPVSYVRLAPSLMNDEREVEQAARAIAALA